MRNWSEYEQAEMADAWLHWSGYDQDKEDKEEKIPVIYPAVHTPGWPENWDTPLAREEKEERKRLKAKRI